MAHQRDLVGSKLIQGAAVGSIGRLPRAAELVGELLQLLVEGITEGHAAQLIPILAPFLDVILLRSRKTVFKNNGEFQRLSRSIEGTEDETAFHCVPCPIVGGVAQVDSIDDGQKPKGRLRKVQSTLGGTRS